MKRFLIGTFLILCIQLLFSGHSTLFGQNESVIHGTVVTKSGEEFTGFMRWGKEELYWHDLFNAEKQQSDQYKVNREEESSGLWSGFDWDLNSLWKNKYSNSSHLFACQFGEIQSLYVKRGDNVSLEMKNGIKILLNGGSNDVGTTVNLYDYELGNVKLEWRKIDEIHFSEAPADADNPYGDGLHGQVKTRRNGTIEGFIKWDLDERCGEDVLDGDSKYGDQKIKFKNIAAIEKEGKGSIVTTHSGKEMKLVNSNDVDSGNRGIRVYNPNVGNIEIDWSDFRKVDFYAPENSSPHYSDYGVPQGLKAQIKTYDDGDYEGLIVYDIDEMWEIETLDGEDNDLSFQIPFRNIRKIKPKNDSYSMVYLWCGEDYLLGGSQDVRSSNNGILIFTSSKKDPISIKWNDIDEIVFK